ncbi:BTAD domain-containing putative transcriptional regulator [Spirillospora sp. NPDC127200]
MYFRVLGPVELLVGDRNIVPTAPKPRQVIALLLLRRNTLVRTEELIDELWENGPPRSATTTLQTYIYKLRQRLTEHDAEEILTTRPGGYMLTVPDDSIDLCHFERDAEEGQALMEAADPARASQVLDRALGHWRGRALVDVVQGGLLCSYTTRLEELRSRTLDLRIEADLRLGRHRELISELKSLVLTHPLDEHLHASLMLALHRSGRRHEALEVYRALRGNMIEDLGLEPGAELKRLHQALLSDSPATWPPETEAAPAEVSAPAPAPAGPPGPGPAARTARVPAPASAPGAATPLRASAAPRPAVSAPSAHAAPPPRPAPPAQPMQLTAPMPPPAAARPRLKVDSPAQLPDDVADFTGRAEAVRDVVAWLTAAGHPPSGAPAAPIAVLTGMPGVGKTALAVHAAHKLRPRFPDGQLYADLRASAGTPADASEVIYGFLRALGVPASQVPGGLEERGRLFRATTAGRRLLVVLDDAAPPADLRPLLPDDPRCAVLVTSRRNPHGPAGARHVVLDVLDRAEAAELLARMVGRGRLEQAPRAAERLVELTTGLPLALRCVGRRLASAPDLAVAELADRLARHPQTLDMLRIGDLDVRSRYDSSYDGLSRLEQGIFRLLSMLPPGEFTADAAARLLGWEIANVERALERFVDDHLLKVAPVADGQIRYVFPELTRNYARERLYSMLTTAAPAGGGAGEAVRTLREPDQRPPRPLLPGLPGLHGPSAAGVCVQCGAVPLESA